MKKYLNRKIAIIMTFVLIVPLLWNMNITEASAATPTPSFVKSSIEIVGVGETVQLEIKDKVDKSKYSWTSTDTKIAKVTSKGLVTSVNPGSTTIKCKITYPNKKTKTISCKVTITIPAIDIYINNAILANGNGAHVLNLGDTMDFNCDLTPANSSDKVLWSIGRLGDPSCIRIDDDKNGKITAIKAGKAILIATAAKAATKEATELSYVYDAVIIEVVGPTATYKSADITDSNQLVVVFNSPVDQSTVIGAKGLLSENIEVTLGYDIKGVAAADPGKLTASLSSDGKTLTITSEKPFSGAYGISFTSNIKTTGGIALDSDYKKLIFADITPPKYDGTTTDDTGMVATISFNEPINFANMRISGAKLITMKIGEVANQITLNYLNNNASYEISEDKKSLTIDMSKISYTDYNKMFSIVISGITDMSGNPPEKAYIEAYFGTDTSYKPQASIYSVVRTSYNTITAYFTRAIQPGRGGYARIAGSAITMYGTVDSIDKKMVNYTLSGSDALLTGMKTVSIGSWNSYNVDPNDTSANKMYDWPVDFTVDVSSPILMANVYDADTGILTLTYSKDVTLTNTSGIFVSTYNSASQVIRPNTPINYTRIVHTDGNNIIKLQLTGTSLIGKYTFTLEQGFVTDSFRNKSLAIPLEINNSSGTSSELPAPYSITQNTDNLSVITLRFLYMLDFDSAQTVSNYSIPGLTILSARLAANTPEGGGIVELTVADSLIEHDLDYPITIKGVKGYNNSYSAITECKKLVALKENVRPYYLDPPVFDTVAKNNIKMSFSEAIQGTITVKATQTVGTTVTELPVSSVSIDGRNVIINTVMPINNSFVKIEIINCNITDMSGNQVISLPPTLVLLIRY